MDLQALLSRDVGISEVLSAVNEIVMEVGRKGNAALFKYTEKFEGARLDDLRVSEEEIDAAYDLVEERLMEALTDAADNIFKFHNSRKSTNYGWQRLLPGSLSARRSCPLSSVGAYVPGRKSFLSETTALMNVIPAKVGRCFQDN